MTHTAVVTVLAVGESTWCVHLHRYGDVCRTRLKEDDATSSVAASEYSFRGGTRSEVTQSAKSEVGDFHSETSETSVPNLEDNELPTSTSSEVAGARTDGPDTT